MSTQTDKSDKKSKGSCNTNTDSSHIMDTLIDNDNSDSLAEPTPLLEPVILNQDKPSDSTDNDTTVISTVSDVLIPVSIGDVVSGDVKDEQEKSNLDAKLDGLAISSHDVDPKTNHCHSCVALRSELENTKRDKMELAEKVAALEMDLETSRRELDREVQRRVELDQSFTEEAKRTTDQIEEIVIKSDRDDAKLNEIRKKFETYSRETSTMIENFTTNREVLASQLLELREENNYLLGQYLNKAQELQNADIDLPQGVEELQFHCLTLNEKLILATMAKERLEETLVKSSSIPQSSNTSSTNSSLPA